MFTVEEIWNVLHEGDVHADKEQLHFEDMADREVINHCRGLLFMKWSQLRHEPDETSDVYKVYNIRGTWLTLLTAYRQILPPAFDLSKLFVMLELKHTDYGADPLLDTGQLGMFTRCISKTSRLQNVMRDGAQVTDETALETLGDLVNYCVLAVFMLDGKLERKN